MTSQPASIPSPTLDPATTTTLLRNIFGALPIIPNATQKDIDTQRTAAVESITALDPCDPIEAALVARHAAAHYAAIDASHVVMRADLLATLKLRFQAKAITLSRLASALHAELRRQQALRIFRPATQSEMVATQPTQQPDAQQAPAQPAPSAQPAAAQPSAITPQPTEATPPTADQAAQGPAAVPAQRSTEAAKPTKPNRTDIAFAKMLTEIAARQATSPTALAA